MKKVVFLLVIFMAVTGAMFAQSAESIFGAIPTAEYTKGDDNAVWTFGATGLTIRNSEGSITIPIRNMRDLAAASDSDGAGLTFAFDTEENRRTYKIISNPLNRTVFITITKNGVTLPKTTLTRR